MQHPLIPTRRVDQGYRVILDESKPAHVKVITRLRKSQIWREDGPQLIEPKVKADAKVAEPEFELLPHQAKAIQDIIRTRESNSDTGENP